MVDRGIGGGSRNGPPPTETGRRPLDGRTGRNRSRDNKPGGNRSTDAQATLPMAGNGTGGTAGRSAPVAKKLAPARRADRKAEPPETILERKSTDLAGLSADLMRAIRRITRAVDVQSKRVTRASGLTIPQIVILQSLHDRGALSTGGLASEISLSAPTVTTVLDRLEGRGLVRRTRKPEDRRIVLTALTDRGREVLSQAPTLMHDEFLTAFAGMDDDAQIRLVAALRTLADLMDTGPLNGNLLLDEGEPAD